MWPTFWEIKGKPSPTSSVNLSDGGWYNCRGHVSYRYMIFPPFGLKFMKTKLIAFDPICHKIISLVRGWGVFHLFRWPPYHIPGLVYFTTIKKQVTTWPSHIQHWGSNLDDIGEKWVSYLIIPHTTLGIEPGWYWWKVSELPDHPCLYYLLLLLCYTWLVFYLFSVSYI